CGGRRTIDEASRAAGLDPVAVARELSAAAREEDEAPWATMGVAELVDHIEAVHHRYLWDELPLLSTLADKIAGVHGGRHPELAEVRRLVDELRADLEQHLAKEERVLFPAVRALAASGSTPTFACGGLSSPISVMLVEHDRAGALLARLRVVTGGYQVPSDGCASYGACYGGLAELEADTHLHVHKENNVLFPAVVALEDRQAAASATTARGRAPVTPPRPG
ncbi:MAG TPA: hemerythrin domain-containing protein, partial [Acidimicrobiales bacterium]